MNNKEKVYKDNYDDDDDSFNPDSFNLNTLMKNVKLKSEADDDSLLESPNASKIDICNAIDCTVDNLNNILNNVRRLSFDPQVYTFYNTLITSIENEFNDISYLSWLMRVSKLSIQEDSSDFLENTHQPLFNPIYFDICGFFEDILEPCAHLADVQNISLDSWYNSDLSNSENILLLYNDPDHIRRAVASLCDRIIQAVSQSSYLCSMLIIDSESPNTAKSIARVAISISSPAHPLPASILQYHLNSNLGLSLRALNATLSPLYSSNLKDCKMLDSTIPDDAILGLVILFKSPMLSETKNSDSLNNPVFLKEIDQYTLLDIRKLFASRHAMAGRKVLMLSIVHDNFYARAVSLFSSIDCDVTTVFTAELSGPTGEAIIHRAIEENSKSQVMLCADGFRRTFSVVIVADDFKTLETLLNYRIKHGIIGPIIFIARPSTVARILEYVDSQDKIGIISSYLHIISYPVGPRKLTLALKTVIDQEMSELSVEKIKHSTPTIEDGTFITKYISQQPEVRSSSVYKKEENSKDSISSAVQILEEKEKLLSNINADSVPSKVTAATDRSELNKSIREAGKKTDTKRYIPHINVMIAEDNPLNQKLLKAFMKRLGIEPTCVSNGKQALEEFQNSKFHLVLMDISMPIMDGLEATAKIREYESKKRLEEISKGDGKFITNSIVVALTSSSSPTDRDMALAAGCNDFLIKPVSFDWLERKIIEWGSMQALICL